MASANWALVQANGPSIYVHIKISWAHGVNLIKKIRYKCKKNECN